MLSELTLTTAIRTAAMSVLPPERWQQAGLPPHGAHRQRRAGEFQALAFHHLLGIEEVRLFDIDGAATAKLMRNPGAHEAAPASLASVHEAVRGADIITTVTADKTSARIIG